MQRACTGLSCCVLLLLFAPAAHAQKPYNPLEGSWRLTSQTLVYEDSTVVRDDLPPSTKILNSTHFAWGYQTDNGEEALAGGGRYELLGDSVYVEHLEYHTTPPLVGMTLRFKARVEGDTWYHTGQIGDFLLMEVWQRVR